MPKIPLLARFARHTLTSRFGKSRVCYVDLPRAGLGHRLLVWARGLAFGWTNDLPVLVSPWPQLKIGPILRGERQTRFYFDTFDDPRAVDPLRGQLLLRLGENVIDPVFERLPDARAEAPFTVYVFREPTHWSRPFEGIREHRARVRDELFAMLVDRRRRELAALPAPVIGVHVRQGDFRPLRPGESFPGGHVQAPLSYFKARILGLRKVSGQVLPVTLFSDGNDQDLAELLALPAVTRSPATADIVDMLLLSRSRVVLGAPGSSFSDWGAFLSEAIVLKHPDHFHGPARPESVRERVFEGPAPEDVDAWPEELRAQVRAIG